MLRDSLLAVVRDELPAAGTCRGVFDFLTKNELRLFRNSIAHGRWDYASNFSGLIYWAQPTAGAAHREHFVDQATFDFWQRLARASNYAVVLALVDSHSSD